MNYPSGSCNPVCYAVTPTFFGPGWDTPVDGSPGANGAIGGPNASATDAYGPGGGPTNPAIDTSATPEGAVAGVGGGVDASDIPGAGGVEMGADVSGVVAGLPGADVPSVGADAIGAGAFGAGTSPLPVEAVAALVSTDPSTGAGGGEAAPVGAGAQQATAGAVPIVVLALLIVGGLAGAWARRIRRPRGGIRLR